MATDLPPQIRSQLQKLAQKDAFTESLDDFIKTAIQTLYTSGQQHSQQSCPTALLLAFSHCLCTNAPLQSLAAEFPEPIRKQFVAAVERYQGEMPQLFIDEGIEELCDVEWTIDVSMGRELWTVLLKFQSGRQKKLVLNYEQLSVLVFKVGQVVAYAQNYQI